MARGVRTRSHACLVRAPARTRHVAWIACQVSSCQVRTRGCRARCRRARWTRHTSDRSRAQSWVERAGAREALVEGDLTPPPCRSPTPPHPAVCAEGAPLASLSLPLSLTQDVRADAGRLRAAGDGCLGRGGAQPGRCSSGYEPGPRVRNLLSEPGPRARDLLSEPGLRARNLLSEDSGPWGGGSQPGGRPANCQTYC